MIDVFKRWDGFKYYASLSEFLPSVSLVFILWTALSVSASLLIWIIVRFVSLIFSRIKAEDILIFFITATVIVFLLYSGKSLLKNIEITNIIKFIFPILVALLSFFVAWLLNKKSESLFEFINERINPLVWLFGILLITSLPLVAYKTIGTKEQQKLQLGAESNFENKNRPNIILVTFDALTARNMSVYGYQRQTTPFINYWAKTASLFSNVKASSTYTTPTTSSLMTGKRVWTHQTYFVEVASKYVGGKNENLPFLLKKYGYTNLALQQIHQASVKKLGVSESFDFIFGPEELSYTTMFYKHIDGLLNDIFSEKILMYDWIIKEDFILFNFLNRFSADSSVTDHRPEIAFNKFLEILDSGIRKPYFAWIHLFAPHDPYLPPEPFKGMFNPSKELRTWKSQMRSRPLEKIGIYRDRYDEFIRYADKQFENFILELEKSDVMKNTVIILSSDHGESFDHNYKGHGGSLLYEQLTHIPLIIKEPRQNEGHTIDNLVEQIDITPTILKLAQIKVPSWIEGRSLLPLLRGGNLLSKSAFAMVLVDNPSRGHEIKKGTIAIWEGDYKLIHYLEEKKSLFFNLKQDPDELYNLFDKKPEMGQHLLSLIQENLKIANERISMENNIP